LKKFKIKWCKKCVLPNTRPNLKIDKFGICSVCNLKTDKVNWKKRYINLIRIVKKIKKVSKSNYDCIVPVSGGKDSYWQIMTVLKLGLNPLAVTWRPAGRNNLGERNLKNLISLGVDHIDYSINPEIEGHFMLKALKKFGSIGIPMHLAIFNITYKLALAFKIPLIVWGENPSTEYGYKEISETKKNPNYKYFMGHNITKNKSINFWKDNILKNKNLNGFNIEKKINNYPVKSIFLGDFIKWDPRKIFKIVKKVGFKESKKAKTGLYNFADLDDDFISIHHYLKWYKFGFTRLFDNLSIEIRNKRISRSKAIALIRKYKAEKPSNDIKLFCKFVNISIKQFNLIINKFRNKNIWYKNSKKKWVIKDFITNKYVWE